MATHADAEPFANGAAVSVGRDDVLRPHEALRPVRQVADDRRDAVRVLLQRGALGAVPQPRAELLRPGPQDRFDASWLMNSRTVGLNSSTPALRFGK
jgi:hypothetical protein